MFSIAKTALKLFDIGKYAYLGVLIFGMLAMINLPERSFPRWILALPWLW
jgi:hypothetical protein